MTLKKSQGHEMWYELVDSKQGYDNAKLEKTSLEQSLKKQMIKVFVKSQNMSILSHLNMLESQNINKHTKLQLNWIIT